MSQDHGVTGAQFEKMYPRWSTFVEIRDRLDPTRMFINDNLQKIF